MRAGLQEAGIAERQLRSQIEAQRARITQDEAQCRFETGRLETELSDAQSARSAAVEQSDKLRGELESARALVGGAMTQISEEQAVAQQQCDTMQHTTDAACRAAHRRR